MQTEHFFKRPLVLSGSPKAVKALEFFQKNPSQTARLVEAGFKLAEPLKDDPRYDHHWPTAYGLERVVCAEGGSCAPPSVMPKDKWDKAWDDAKATVAAYYKAEANK